MFNTNKCLEAKEKIMGVHAIKSGSKFHAHQFSYHENAPSPINPCMHAHKNVGLWVNCNDTWLQNYSSLHDGVQNVHWSGINASYQKPTALFFSNSASRLASDSISSLVRNCPFSSASLESCFSSYENRREEREKRGEGGKKNSVVSKKK